MIATLSFRRIVDLLMLSALTHRGVPVTALGVTRADGYHGNTGESTRSRSAAMNIGRIGIWTFLDLQPAKKAQEAAAEIESLGFGAIWIPEALGREAFSSAGMLLAGTS